MSQAAKTLVALHGAVNDHQIGRMRSVPQQWIRIAASL